MTSAPRVTAFDQRMMPLAIFPVRGALPCQRLPATTDPSREAVLERRRRLRAAGYEIEQISGSGAEIDPERLAGSVEGFIGFARVPLGVAGPIRIVGSAAAGEFFVPFATSEGTLVASFQHAFNAMTRSGGATALCGDAQVGRAPLLRVRQSLPGRRVCALAAVPVGRYFKR